MCYGLLKNSFLPVTWTLLTSFVIAIPVTNLSRFRPWLWLRLPCWWRRRRIPFSLDGLLWPGLWSRLRLLRATLPTARGWALAFYPDWFLPDWFSPDLFTVGHRLRPGLRPRLDLHRATLPFATMILHSHRPPDLITTGHRLWPGFRLFTTSPFIPVWRAVILALGLPIPHPAVGVAIYPWRRIITILMPVVARCWMRRIRLRIIVIIIVVLIVIITGIVPVIRFALSPS